MQPPHLIQGILRGGHTNPPAHPDRKGPAHPDRKGQAAFDAARVHSCVAAGIERGEAFRLLLVGMRAYIELYAVMSHRLACAELKPADLAGVMMDGSKPLVPIMVTRDEYMWVLPMLRRWGVAPADAAAAFDGLDAGGVGVVKFDDFARGVLPRRHGQSR